ncbi:MAG: DNA-3-methyladenine glycosylase I [Spirosomataceae bacterium]
MNYSNSYCQFALSKPLDDVNRVYHDTQYGFPIHDDNELFGRLILEIFQAGLSWTLILNKQQNFAEAFDNFNIEVIANYSDYDCERLQNDSGIVRNKLKINAAIHNANVILDLQKEYGSFENWLELNHLLDKAAWVKLFKKTFKFTGGEITNEFLMSTGYLPGTHGEDCSIYYEITKENSKRMQK